MGWLRQILYLSIPLLVAYYFYSGAKFDSSSIRGKRVLVTGASSGIGEQVAYAYAGLGAQLVITARRSDQLERVAKRCQELGASKVFPVPADMAKASDRVKVVGEVEKRLGGVDFVILNHAFIHFGTWKNTEDNMTRLKDMMEVNFLSFVDISSRLTPALEKSKGHIGVVTSMAGKIGALKMTQYCANKHALHGFYSSLRQELRRKNSGVSVTLVVYGPVATEKAKEMTNVIKMNYDIMKVAGSTESAAEVLVRGVSKRQYEVYYPAVSGITVFLGRLFPHWMEDVTSNGFEIEDSFWIN